MKLSKAQIGEIRELITALHSMKRHDIIAGAGRVSNEEMEFNRTWLQRCDDALKLLPACSIIEFDNEDERNGEDME